MERFNKFLIRKNNKCLLNLYEYLMLQLIYFKSLKGVHFEIVNYLSPSSFWAC